MTDLLTSLPLMQETLLSHTPHDWVQKSTAREDIVARWKCARCGAGMYIRHIPETRLWVDYYDVSGYSYGKEAPPCLSK